MTYFNAFCLSLGAILAATMILSAWIFRTASAPFAMKLFIPLILVFLACYAPWKVSAMMGYPALMAQSALPARAQLLAFDPHDAENVVDLWLRVGAEPRAYRVALTESMKKTLHEAEAALKHGKLVTLVRGGKRADKLRGGDRNGIGDTEHDFTLDFSSDLPQKGASAAVTSP